MLTTTALAFIMAIVYVLWRPERRHRILSFFRKRNVAVQYTRVSKP